MEKKILFSEESWIWPKYNNFIPCQGLIATSMVQQTNILQWVSIFTLRLNHELKKIIIYM